MANSILVSTGEQAPVVNKGHGTAALGPSDSSDSGSDVMGGPGVVEDAGLPLDRGTFDDPGGGLHENAGPDLGDFNLDSDSDRNGTGERLSAGRDDVAREGADIAVDHVENLSGMDDDDELSMSEVVEDVETTSAEGPVDSPPSQTSDEPSGADAGAAARRRPTAK